MKKLSFVLTAPEGTREIAVGDAATVGEFVLGRSSEAGLFLNDPGVSRRHCRIRVRDGAFEVEDLGSRAGTRLNGRPLDAPARLAHGDELTVGGVLLRVKLVGDGDRDVDEEETIPPPPAREEARTIVAPRGAVPTKAGPRLSVEVPEGVVSLGRDPACTIPLDHVLVSRRHAEIRRTDGETEVRDLGSTNGTFVNGKAVDGTAPLAAGDVLSLGPFRLHFDGIRVTSAPAAAGMRIEVREIGKEVNDRQTGRRIHLLRNLSLTIEPREFVGISTFMDTLNGRRPATEGAVLYDGKNLYNHFDSYKRGIGYVPQELIFHPELPVGDALRYASRLRLPDDTTDREIEENIDRVLTIVGLAGQKGTLVTNLSGGQKKRVSIAIELLSRPTVLFLDEATSGLDLGTEAQMMKLFRELAEGGATTLCITHYVDSLDACDMVACLIGGRLAFYGPPDELKTYFGVKAIRDVYLLENERTPEEWETRYRESDAHRRYVTGRAAPPRDEERTVVRPGQAMEQIRPSDPVRQLSVLIRRYVQVLSHDRRNLLLMFALAPVIGVLASLVLSGGHGADVHALARQQGQLCFMMTLTMFFLGVFGGIREIVKELPVYRHERFVNLEILPYVGSKLIPLAAIAGVQTALLLLTVHALADMRANLIGQFVILFPTAVGALTLGLAISAAVDTADKAILLMILVLIPQLLFANAFIELGGFGEFVAGAGILSYWCHDGLKSLLPDRLLDLTAPSANLYAPAKPFLFGHNGWFLDLFMIVVFFAIYAALVLWFLRRKDGPYGKPFRMPFVRSGYWIRVQTRSRWLARACLAGAAQAIRAARSTKRS